MVRGAAGGAVTGRPNRLLTDMLREVRRTFKRFMSLFVMSFLAVGFLSGLRMTAPDMQRTVDLYYDRLRFMDIRVVSSLGLTEDDLQALQKVEGVQAAEGSFSFDALAGEETVTVFSLPQTLTLLDLQEGRMPEKDSECVTEEKVLEALDLKIGDTITVDTSESYESSTGQDLLRQHTFTIVGMVHSPLYISRTRGNSEVGSGSVTGFVAIPGACFTQDYYSSIYLELEGLSQYNCYLDDAYTERVDAFIERLKPLAKERASHRHDQILRETSLTDMLTQMITGDLSAVDIPSGKWYLLSRESIRSYVEFSSDAERMSNLADVFPLVFFLVAALSSLTSMTRMVEEHRSEIGSLKALGFSDAAVSVKYLGYSLGSSLLGGGAGLLIGCAALPSLIYYEWGILYLLPPLKWTISLPVALYSLGFAVLATAGAALAACYTTLRSNPAVLLRPRAPRPGKRILLERIAPIWKRLSFIQKVSARNLFRYKKRFWMTIAGIAGCTALLVTGFGLRDSIFDVLRWQFDDLMVYNADVSISEDLTQSERIFLEKELEEDPDVESFAGCYLGTLSVRNSEGTLDNVSLTVSSDWEKTGQYIHLYPRSGGTLRYRKIEPPPELRPAQDSIIIDEKMSELLHVQPGDTIMLVDAREEEHPVRVGDVAENYVNHQVFMTAGMYKTVFGERSSDNTLLLRLREGADSGKAAERITSIRGVLTYSRIDELRQRFEDSMRSLDAVVLIIIGAAAMLAFLVLFNLTNINVTERIRELATLKVLGFYDMETASYVYRENIILTLIGALIGMAAGKGLHRWLIGTIEVDYLIFGRGLHVRSYLYAVLLTAVFSLSVNFFSFFSIQKIDMVESLKSVE